MNSEHLGYTPNPVDPHHEPTIKTPNEFSERHPDDEKVELVPSSFKRILEDGFRQLERPAGVEAEEQERPLEAIERRRLAKHAAILVGTVLVLEEAMTTIPDIGDIPKFKLDRFNILGALDTPEKKAVAQRFYMESLQRRIDLLSMCKKRNEESPATILSPIHALEIWNRLAAEQQELLKHVKVEIPKPLSGLPKQLQDQIASHCNSVSLNVGCSARCPFCAFSAEKNVREIVPFAQAAWLIMNTPKKNDTFFYEATDPGDYEYKGHTYGDIVTIQEAVRGNASYVSTAVPHGSWDRIKAMSDCVNRISVSYANIGRLKKMGVLTEVDGVTLPSNPDATDILYHEGVASLTRQLGILLVSVVGEKKHERNIDPEALRKSVAAALPGYKSGVADLLNDHNLRDAGKQRKVVKKGTGIGSSIECRQGVHVTPERVLNYLPALSTEKFPDGKIEVQISNPNEQDNVERIRDILKQLKDGKNVEIQSLISTGLIQPVHGDGQGENAAILFREKVSPRHSPTFRIFSTKPEESVLWTTEVNTITQHVPEFLDLLTSVDEYKEITKKAYTGDLYISPDFIGHLKVAYARRMQHKYLRKPGEDIFLDVFISDSDTSFQPHSFTLNVYHSDSFTKQVWVCIYNLVDGNILTLRCDDNTSV